MKLVQVEWEDASECDTGPWVDRGTATEPKAVIFHQVGYLFGLTSSEVVLTSCVGEDQMGVRSRIPAGMVRSIVELHMGEPLKFPKRKRA